jgi:hypothetical protein
MGARTLVAMPSACRTSVGRRCERAARGTSEATSGVGGYMSGWIQPLIEELIQPLIRDLKGLVLAVVAAIVGGFIKWLFDRRLVRELTQEREEARRDRKVAIEGRESALKEREMALQDLAKRETENQARREKLDELQRELDSHKRGVDGERSKLDKLLATLRGNDAGLWNTFPKSLPFTDYDARIGRRKPLIITVANNKGGVSKTTIVGNLIACFDRQLKLRVLAIDLDYQGSLSTMLRLERGKADARTSNVNALLERGAGLGSLYAATRGLGERLPRSELASAFYELALLEDRLMVEWLLQEGGDDVRYRLDMLMVVYGMSVRFFVLILVFAV